MRQHLNKSKIHTQTTHSQLALFRIGQIGTGQERSGQVMTGQDRSRQVRTGQDRSGQVRIGQDRFKQVRTGLYWSVHDRTWQIMVRHNTTQDQESHLRISLL